MLSKQFARWFKKQQNRDQPPLTAREQKFCHHYVACYNGPLAAMKAGFGEKEAHKAAATMMENPQVAQEVMRLRQNRGQMLHLCHADIVERYMAIAFADITDVVAFGTRDDPEAKHDNFMHLLPSAKALGAAVSQIAVDGDKITVKLEDRMKALEWLSDYFMLNPLEKQRVLTERQKYRLSKAQAQQEATQGEQETDGGGLRIEILRKGEVVGSGEDGQDEAYSKNEQ